MDLQEFLVAITPQLEARAGIESVDVSLWEGGVRLSLMVRDAPLGLKFRPRIEGAAYAQLPSCTVALDLPEGATLSEGAKQVAEAVLAVLRKVDDGTMTVPADTVEEDEEVVEDVAPEPGVFVGMAAAPVVLSELASSPPEFQRALLEGAGLSGGVIAVLDGARLVGDRDARAFVDAVAGQALWIDGRASTSGVVADLVAHALALGCTPVGVRTTMDQVVHGGPPPGLHRAVVEGMPQADALAAWVEAGVRVQVLLPGAFMEDEAAADTVAAVIAARAEVVVVPDFAAMPLDAAPERLQSLGRRVRVVGLPNCVAPQVRRAVAEAGLLMDDRPARVWAGCCVGCAAREGCPGIAGEGFEAHGDRGLEPVVWG